MAEPSRRPLVSANWKMNLNHLETINILQKLSYTLGAASVSQVEVSIHPPFTSLRSAQTVIDADAMPFALGAQDVHWEASGAFTGEVSPGMLAKLNVSYVITGHSERRQLFGETDDMVRRKVAAVAAAGMTPILCVGETMEERDAGRTEERVVGQLRAALAGLGPEQVGAMVVAYEPIWAIGTGRNATAEDASAVCGVIRAAVLADHGSAAAGLRVQYGGSVKAANASSLLGAPDVDGALVGGASLDPAEFSAIVACASPGSRLRGS